MPNINPVILGGSTSAEEWVRPSDWTALPTVVDTDERFVGLYAIHPNGNNFCTLKFTTSTGNYEVDWGDGTVEEFASNVKAEHEYNYSTYDVSETTLSTRGYKQAIVSVTPVTGTFSTFNFQERFTGQTVAYSTGWLDIIMSTPNHTTGTSSFGGSTIRHAFLERFTYLAVGARTTMTSMFQNCYSLQSVPLFNTAIVTNMSSMFNGCYSLQSVPLFNTAIATNMSNMFQSCFSLKSVPLFNTASVTLMSTMLSACYSLRTVPLFNTVIVSNMSYMFNGCYSLQSVPLFNTATVTNMSYMFQSCSSLQSVPLFNTASVTTMTSMFSNCQSLQYIPAISTAGITTIAGTDFGTSFAANCNSLDACDMIFARTVTLSNGQLSRDEIVNIFNNLVDRSATTSATITITGNYGISTLSAADRLIATDKNWVIVE